MAARSGLELAAKDLWERAREAAPAAVACRNVRRFMRARITAEVQPCPDLISSDVGQRSVWLGHSCPTLLTLIHKERLLGAARMTDTSREG
jgi:hypothetical protein